MSSDEADRDDIKMDDDDRDPIAIRSIVTGICYLKEWNLISSTISKHAFKLYPADIIQHICWGVDIMVDWHNDRFYIDWLIKWFFQ